MSKAKLGIAPTAWWTDDDASLSGNVSLEEALRRASAAGFTGRETGRRFPMNMEALGRILDEYAISVCGGWFSGLVLDGGIEAEKDRIVPARLPQYAGSIALSSDGGEIVMTGPEGNQGVVFGVDGMADDGAEPNQAQDPLILAEDVDSLLETQAVT